MQRPTHSSRLTTGDEATQPVRLDSFTTSHKLFSLHTAAMCTALQSSTTHSSMCKYNTQNSHTTADTKHTPVEESAPPKYTTTHGFRQTRTHPVASTIS